MNTKNVPACFHAPPIVRTVSLQASKARAEGAISQATFDAQILRLTEEELGSRRLVLLERELSDGRTRFLIRRQDTHAVCDLIEWPAADFSAQDEEAPREDEMAQASLN